MSNYFDARRARYVRVDGWLRARAAELVAMGHRVTVAGYVTEVDLMLVWSKDGKRYATVGFHAVPYRWEVNSRYYNYDLSADGLMSAEDIVKHINNVPAPICISVFRQDIA